MINQKQPGPVKTTLRVLPKQPGSPSVDFDFGSVEGHLLATPHGMEITIKEKGDGNLSEIVGTTDSDFKRAFRVLVPRDDGWDDIRYTTEVTSTACALYWSWLRSCDPSSVQVPGGYVKDPSYGIWKVSLSYHGSNFEAYVIAASEPVVHTMIKDALDSAHVTDVVRFESYDVVEIFLNIESPFPLWIPVQKSAVTGNSIYKSYCVSMTSEEWCKYAPDSMILWTDAPIEYDSDWRHRSYYF